ncbi:MAG TPA: hypothetical protein VFE32_12905 [Puia sp.]|nr:hypothetical protein [Puia sp.]
MLKRIAAILLLSVLLFNWLGYRLLTAFWEDHAATRLQGRLDNDQYDPSQLILLRVSADALPYSNSTEQFQRSDGFIEIGPTRYRTVKRRLYNDSIEFLCIPDGAANRVRTAGNDFFSLVNDLQKPGHSKFPGHSGKTGPTVNKIIWCDAHHFPVLHYFAARLALFPHLMRTALSPGHSRIGLQPPRQEYPLS